MSKAEARTFVVAGRIIKRMKRLYGKRFDDMWKGVDAREMQEVWAEAFAGYSDAELQRGLQACLTHQWSPTLPEFLGWCRPQMTAEMAFTEAQRNLKEPDLQKRNWSSKAVYWTAEQYGFYDVKQHGWAKARQRWTAIWQSMTARKDLLEIPVMKQLNAPDAKRTAVVSKAHKQRLRVLIGKASAKMTEAA